jgi:hypothetical protein
LNRPAVLSVRATASTTWAPHGEALPIAMEIRMTRQIRFNAFEMNCAE